VITLPKQITDTAIIIELSEDTKISEFLNHQKKSTRNTYTSMFRRLKEFINVSGEEMLAEPSLWKKKIFEFQRHLLEHDYSEYYAQTATSMIRGFFDYHDKRLDFNRADRKRLSERNRKTEDYLFDKSDISRMAMHGNLREKYVLLVGKSVGLRAGDFVNITYGKLRGLRYDIGAPVFIGETVTQKERVKAYPFLDSDAIEIVKAVLEANKDKPNDMYILMTKSKKKHNTYQRMQDAELSYILQSLARKAKIEHGSKRIRFHCLRKYLSDRLSSVMSESKWKQIVGKKISEGAYISADSLREDYAKAMPSIAISSNGNGRVSELEKKIESQSKMIEFLKETADGKEEYQVHFESSLLEKIDALEQKIAQLEKKKET
jgi:integrase